MSSTHEPAPESSRTTGGLNVGIVGATGLVGSMMRTLLADRQFPVRQLRCFASSRSAGQALPWADSTVVVEDIEGASFRGLDVVLLSAGADVSRDVAPKVAADGAIAIDNSSAWRMDCDIPLVVSDVNSRDITLRPKGIIANPNCTTMIAMQAVKPLHDAAGLTRIVSSTYQAVSGAGNKGVRELESQLGKLQGRADELASGTLEDLPLPQVFAAPIAHNVVSIAGNLVDDETDEEHKFRNESRKILNLPDLDVSCTCIRVPVFTGHSVSLELEFERAIDVDEAKAQLLSSAGLRLCDVPTPLEAAGKDVSLVGRVRQSAHHPRRIAVFVSGDNLRKGAALNTVQIAEALIHHW